MVRLGKSVKDARKRVLRTAEEIATHRAMDGISSDLGRVGVVWAGILDLDSVIPPTVVAAMLASHELVIASTTEDSEESWTNAAAYSSIGCYVDSGPYEEDPEDEQTDIKAKVGFVNEI